MLKRGKELCKKKKSNEVYVQPRRNESERKKLKRKRTTSRRGRSCGMLREWLAKASKDPVPAEAKSDEVIIAKENEAKISPYVANEPSSDINDLCNVGNSIVELNVVPNDLNFNCYRHLKDNNDMSDREEKCDSAEEVELFQESPQPSTSDGRGRGRNGIAWRRVVASDSSDQEKEKKKGKAMDPKKRIKRKPKTSTPTKQIPKPRARAPKKRQRVKLSARAEQFEAVRAKLDNGLNVELDPDSSFDDQPVTIGPSHQAPEFETTTSSVLSELRALLEDANQSPRSSDWEGSDPNLTSVLLGLIGEHNKFSNPFEVSEKIKEELISRAEQSGARAISWNQTSFELVGGRGTLRSFWNKLKSKEVVGGRKRSLSTSMSCGEEERKKRCKTSLNISGTCEMIENIELAIEEDRSLAASDYEESSSREEPELENAGFLSEVEDEGSVDDFRQIGDSGDLADNDEGNLYASPDSDSDRIPPLTSSEESEDDWPWEGNLNGSDSDSGMTESAVGNVTNLCRSRKAPPVTEGVVTMTGPFIPVTVGFDQEASMESDWEEVLDSDGNPTGYERKSFKLNIVDGRTESLDEDWDMTRRLNGLSDETNNRWHANEVFDQLNMGYQADESDDCLSSELDPDEYGVSVYLDDCRCSDVECSHTTQYNQFGCSRATLIDHPSGGSDRWFGCSRATLMDHPCSGSYRCSGCSRATLSDHPCGGSNRWPGCSRTTLMDQTGEGGYVIPDFLWLAWIQMLSTVLLQVLAIMLMAYDVTIRVGYICGIDQDGGTWPIRSMSLVESLLVSSDGENLVLEAEIGAREVEQGSDGALDGEIHDDEDFEASHDEYFKW